MSEQKLSRLDLSECQDQRAEACKDTVVPVLK
jgi:hypothetical protein